MSPFELTYLCLEPFLPPLQRGVRKRLRQIARSCQCQPEILDVGGRKSHYTIGVPGHVTITDLPRQTDLQRELNLGIDPEMIAQTRARRSNIRRILLDDMTRSALPDRSFDCIVAVEVLEHVEEDARFLSEVCRVLKAGGVFLMTTPNGDYCKNSNPDHKRHYTRAQLCSLLCAHFAEVEVQYAVRGGRFRSLGLRSWSLKRPCRTLLSMAGNLINSVQSARRGLEYQARGTHHLVAVAVKDGIRGPGR